MPSIRAVPTTVTIAKLGNAPDENEDALGVDQSIGRLVIADGASSSFASREWSRSLCEEFLADPDSITSRADFDAAVGRAGERWKLAVTPDGDVAWWAQQGLERGAFSTLLVVDVATIDRKERWRAAAVGDSCLLQFRRSSDAWSIVTSFPIGVGDTFDSYPDLLQTHATHDTAGLMWAEGELKKGDVLVLATDAVSEWLLKDGSPAATAMLAQAGADQLEAEFVRLRGVDEMVNDDCTVVRIVAGREALR